MAVKHECTEETEETRHETADGMKIPPIPLDPEEVLVAAGKIHFPGLNGHPYLGTAIPDIKEDDPRSAKPQLAPLTYARVFNMGKPEHLAAYEKISQRAAQRRSQISFEEREFSSVHDTWLILIRWTDYYYMS